MHIDLNLLTALDALLEEGSVGGAARRLHLSQPAMSRTLGRIREATGDPILVRMGRTMMPTPRALALRQEVQLLVRQARVVLSPERELDLSRLERTFTVRCHDALMNVLGPRLLQAIRKYAPGASLRFMAEADGDNDDLRHGRVDLDISSARPAFTGINYEDLGRDRLVVAFRKSHPCARGRLTAQRYAAALHIIVSRRGRLRDPVDDALETMGLRRRVVATAPTIFAALHCASEDDLVVAVASGSCTSTASALGLRTVRLPLDLPGIPVVQAWHQRFDGDKAHAWLRGWTRKILGGSLAQLQERP